MTLIKEPLARAEVNINEAFNDFYNQPAVWREIGSR